MQLIRTRKYELLNRTEMVPRGPSWESVAHAQSSDSKGAHCAHPPAKRAVREPVLRLCFSTTKRQILSARKRAQNRKSPCHVCQHSARSAVLIHTRKAKKLTIFQCDQWLVSHVIGAIARSTHYSCWKEALAVSSVHEELVRKREWQSWSANHVRTFERSVKST